MSEAMPPLHTPLGKLDPQKERKLIIVGTLVTLAMAAIYLTQKKPAGDTAVTDLSGNATPSGSSGLDWAAIYKDQFSNQLKQTEAIVAHAATLDWTGVDVYDSRTSGSHISDSRGSGGINVFGLFSLGGGGSKVNTTTYDDTTHSMTSEHLAGGNLSETEFALLAETISSLTNYQHNARLSAYNAELARLRLQLQGQH